MSHAHPRKGKAHKPRSLGPWLKKLKPCIVWGRLASCDIRTPGNFDNEEKCTCPPDEDNGSYYLRFVSDGTVIHRRCRATWGKIEPRERLTPHERTVLLAS